MEASGAEQRRVPPGGAKRAGAAATLAGLLARARFEVLPLDGVERAVFEHLGKDVTVTVTASPSRGLEATIALSERLARAGYRVVPHLSARLVRDHEHLDDALARLLEAGVRELFVPAGDAPDTAGKFHGAAQLLEAMGPRRSDFEEIGITGYPESHHLISDDETIQAMFAKAPMASYIVSQICFDADVIAGWIRNVRARGTHLPIYIGMPGLVHNTKLVRVSMKIGLGESARFMRHHGGWASRLLTRRFKPDDLLRELEPTVTDPDAKVAGFHWYTFNEIGPTERWRRRTIERLGQQA